MIKCDICGKEFEGEGHNAEPIKKGVCCDDCNNKVIAIRMLEFLTNRTRKVKVGDKIKILSMDGEDGYSDRIGVWYYTKKIHNNLSSYNLYNYNMQPIITFYNYTDMKQFCMNGAKYEK